MSGEGTCRESEKSQKNITTKSSRLRTQDGHFYKERYADIVGLRYVRCVEGRLAPWQRRVGNIGTVPVLRHRLEGTFQ